MSRPRASQPSHKSTSKARAELGVGTDSAVDVWSIRINQACRLLEQTSFSLDKLALTVGVSKAELQRQFVKRLSVSPQGYSQALKLQKLMRSLPQNTTTLDAVMDSGWSVSVAYAKALSALGVTPARARRLKRIGYWCGLSELGWILMAATDTGICWLSFGDSPDELLEELAAAYPHTEFYNDESRLYEWFNQVRDELLLPHQALKLPMDIQGTAFQIKVWKALKHVPLGQSLSYQQLAAQMGEPQKTRAVARALGSNKIGFLIPCHRIIGQDGSLKGYRWDVKRKAVLLTREQVEHK